MRKTAYEMLSSVGSSVVCSSDLIASDEADAKIGMSINPNLNGELRVTVVAAGLTGSGATAQMLTLAQPNSAGNPRVAQFIRPAEPAMYGQSQQSYGHGMGSQNLDIPPAQRMNAQSYQPPRKVAAAGGGGAFPLGMDEDIINIPA